MPDLFQHSQPLGFAITNLYERQKLHGAFFLAAAAALFKAMDDQLILLLCLCMKKGKKAEAI